MSLYYFDTSALLKRYIVEEGSAWVRTTVEEPEADIIVSQLTIVEGVAALTRRAKGGAFRPGNAARVVQKLTADFQQQFVVIAVNPEVIDKAVDLARQRALCGYDALQLATALVVRSLVAPEVVTFVAADDELIAAAELEGLPSINPVAA